jgi:small subunit ribosomal protein S6
VVLRDYELMMVLSPEVEDQGIADVVEKVKQYVSQQGGVVTHDEQWGRRRLAYPIRKYTEGQYVLTRFQLEPDGTKALESSLDRFDEIIRHLLIKLPESK